MAGKKMVSPKARIREMLKRVKKEKGGFYLAMMAQTSPDPVSYTHLICAQRRRCGQRKSGATQRHRKPFGPHRGQ